MVLSDQCGFVVGRPGREDSLTGTTGRAGQEEQVRLRLRFHKTEGWFCWLDASGKEPTL